MQAAPSYCSTDEATPVQRERNSAPPSRSSATPSPSWPATSSSAPCSRSSRSTISTQALAFLNGSRYGNAGAIFTQSGEAARRYRYEAEAGMLGVNVGVPAPVAWFPFSGWKDSIDGDLHANGTDAVDFYTRKKVVTSRW